MDPPDPTGMERPQLNGRDTDIAHWTFPPSAVSREEGQVRRIGTGLGLLTT